jgi:hypothetical protein
MSPSPHLTQSPKTATSHLSLNDWATRCVNLPGVQVQCWQRQNLLDILCEGETCPEVSIVVEQLTLGLKQINLQNFLPSGSPPVLVICVHGRSLGQKRPNWTVRLNPQDPERVAPLPDVEITERPTRQIFSEIAQVLPPPAEDWHAAREGNPKAIADYLSHALKSWGLGVKVIVKVQTLESSPASPSSSAEAAAEPNPVSAAPNPWSAVYLHKGEAVNLQPQKRLWVVCQSVYSPEPLSIAPSLGARLRELNLQGFKDAVILGQVSGEKQPEWILRVDLTPAKLMLEDWARWGDVQAITQLLNQRLLEALPGSFAEDLQVSGVLKESTLHIFLSDPGLAMDSAAYGPDSIAFNKEAVNAAIAPVLETIAPQNIYGVTIYGLRGDKSAASLDLDSTPLWVDWIDLPASRFSHLAPTTLELARNGDLAALTFLIDRLLHPDLEEKLNTGGMRVSLRQKADLLHILVEAPTCPPRAIGAKVAKFVASLNLPQTLGVRVYGRRSGQKQLQKAQGQWRYGLDFQSRSSRTETIPEFTVTEPTSLVTTADLLPQPGNLVMHPDLNSDDLQSCLTKPLTVKLRKKKEASPDPLQQGLVLSGLFVPIATSPSANLTSAKVTMIWGLLGLLFTLQADWLLAELLQIRQFKTNQAQWQATTAVSDSSALLSASTQIRNPELTDFTAASDSDLGNINWSQVEENAEVFNSSGFTQHTTQTMTEAVAAASLSSFKYPSFNSQQMDDQLAIYAEYVAKYGMPDVLIVGSSRALRGVDPGHLYRQLSDRYPNLRIFNFGINGATAQVVDLLVRQLLGAKQLPRLIIWADGARAFNSGRSDRTFQMITASAGYKELQFGSPPAILPPESKSENSLASLTSSLADRAKKGISFSDAYQQLDRWLNEQVGSLSATYSQRQELHNWFAYSLRNSISDRQKSAESNKPLSCQSTDKNEDTSLVCESAAEGTGNPLDAITITDGKSISHFNGFLPISIQFDPKTYYEQYAFVSGDYDADYESFSLTGQQTTATINLLEFLNQHQVSLVFVNTPLTEDYLDPIRMEHEQNFQKYMLGLALQHGFIFRDFSQEWPKEHQYFSDPSHLNALGAQRISERLSQDPLIPWPNYEAK